MKYSDYAESILDRIWKKNTNFFNKHHEWFGEVDGECNDIIMELYSARISEDKAVEHVIEKKSSCFKAKINVT